jgi:hypothetical protein
MDIAHGSGGICLNEPAVLSESPTTGFRPHVGTMMLRLRGGLAPATSGLRAIWRAAQSSRRDRKTAKL